MRLQFVARDDELFARIDEPVVDEIDAQPVASLARRIRHFVGRARRVT